MSKVCISLQSLLDDFLYFFSQLATVLNHVEEVPWSINTGGMGLDKEPGKSIEVYEARDDHRVTATLFPIHLVIIN